MSVYLSDQLGQMIEQVQPAHRIVSLVPSLTELLSELNLDQEVIGITRFCVHPPEWIKEKAIIGGTKDPNIERIMSLKPDLVIANQEENLKEHVEVLRSLNVTVYVSKIDHLEDLCEALRAIAMLTDRLTEATQLRKKLLQAHVDAQSCYQQSQQHTFLATVKFPKYSAV